MNNKFMLTAVLLLSGVACAMESEKENSLVKIQKWQDVAPFADQFVAYTAKTHYLDCKTYKYLLPRSDLSYGYVDKELSKWGGYGEGYQLYQLLKKDGVPSVTALANEFIDEGSLHMRNITFQEAKEIIEALAAQKAKFVYTWGNEEKKLISQLDLIIKK